MRVKDYLVIWTFYRVIFFLVRTHKVLLSTKSLVTFHLVSFPMRTTVQQQQHTKLCFNNVARHGSHWLFGKRTPYILRWTSEIHQCHKERLEPVVSKVNAQLHSSSFMPIAPVALLCPCSAVFLITSFFVSFCARCIPQHPRRHIQMKARTDTKQSKQITFYAIAVALRWLSNHPKMSARHDNQLSAKEMNCKFLLIFKWNCFLAHVCCVCVCLWVSDSGSVRWVLQVTESISCVI